MFQGHKPFSDRIHDLYVISGDDRKVPEHFEVQVPIQLNSGPIQSSTTHTNVDLNAPRTDALADLRRELRTLPSDKNILQHFGGQVPTKLNRQAVFESVVPREDPISTITGHTREDYLSDCGSPLQMDLELSCALDDLMTIIAKDMPTT